MDTDRGLIKWLISGDTGISSKAIVAQMTGVETNNGWSDYPRDGADFGRCHRLLEIMPEFKVRIEEMSQRSPQWAVLVKHWAELTDLYLAKSPFIYERMEQILSAAPNKRQIDLGNGISFEVPKID
ncbi:hypothetical protein [Nitrosomonas sp. Nm166]|uniref:hypothetical protein n=1 Tax=Nitrosomonas sp. Nm166 TaxID=1881054 RepID=UPI0008ECB0F2|nr:hypothetical protein [Nitrosomonas sp. Nm166]SFF05284.1 hypothetical protein SAMN05428977_104529 [Nitrosomonas sp. Nm166]